MRLTLETLRVELQTREIAEFSIDPAVEDWALLGPRLRPHGDDPGLAAEHPLG